MQWLQNDPVSGVTTLGLQTKEDKKITFTKIDGGNEVIVTITNKGDSWKMNIPVKELNFLKVLLEK